MINNTKRAHAPFTQTIPRTYVVHHVLAPSAATHSNHMGCTHSKYHKWSTNIALGKSCTPPPMSPVHLFFHPAWSRGEEDSCGFQNINIQCWNNATSLKLERSTETKHHNNYSRGQHKMGAAPGQCLDLETTGRKGIKTTFQLPTYVFPLACGTGGDTYLWYSNIRNTTSADTKVSIQVKWRTGSNVQEQHQMSNTTMSAHAPFT